MSIDEMVSQVVAEQAKKYQSYECINITDIKAGILAGLQMAAEVCDRIRREPIEGSSVGYMAGREVMARVCEREILALKGGG